MFGSPSRAPCSASMAPPACARALSHRVDQAAAAGEQTVPVRRRRLDRDRHHGRRPLVAEHNGQAACRAGTVTRRALEQDEQRAEKRRWPHAHRLRIGRLAEQTRDAPQVGVVGVQLQYARDDVLHTHRLGHRGRLGGKHAIEPQAAYPLVRLLGPTSAGAADRWFRPGRTGASPLRATRGDSSADD